MYNLITFDMKIHRINQAQGNWIVLINRLQILYPAYTLDGYFFFVDVDELLSIIRKRPMTVRPLKSIVTTAVGEDGEPQSGSLSEKQDPS